MAVTFMSLMLLSLHLQLSAFLPQYITFGHQHYRKDTEVGQSKDPICHLHHDFTSTEYLKEAIASLSRNGCFYSTLAFTHLSLHLDFPLLHLLLFFVTVLFLILFSLFFVYHGVYKPHDSADLGSESHHHPYQYSDLLSTSGNEEQEDIAQFF